MKLQRRSQGQGIVFLIALLPVLVVLAGVTVRWGKTLLIHQQLQNHCDKKVLDSLEQQGRGLQALGRLNPIAKKIIDLRRHIDQTLALGLAAPPLIPVLKGASASLRAAQTTMALKQKLATQAALAASLAVMKKQSPLGDRGKIKEVFSPQGLLAPHPASSSLRLHVEPAPGYESETGAPSVLDRDFDRRQHVRGRILMETEKFLDFWPGFKRASPLEIICEAKIEMSSLEDKWNGHLIPIEVKPSSRIFSGLR